MDRIQLSLASYSLKFIKLATMVISGYIATCLLCLYIVVFIASHVAKLNVFDFTEHAL